MYLELSKGSFAYIMLSFLRFDLKLAYSGGEKLICLYTVLVF